MSGCVPVTGRIAAQRAHELTAMVDGAATVGPRNWWGTLLRLRTERWAKREIAEARTRKEGEGDAPIDVIAWHRQPNGELLDAETAAVELINILRPTVAVDRYIAFCALALHLHPHLAAKLRNDTDDPLHRFVQEVRRDVPYFPFGEGVCWSRSSGEGSGSSAANG